MLSPSFFKIVIKLAILISTSIIILSVMIAFLNSLNLAHPVSLFLAKHSLATGFFLLLIEESGIPIPIPGDLVISSIGYLVLKEKTSYSLAFFTLLLSVIIGSSILYFISFILGDKIINLLGKFLPFKKDKLKEIEKNFDKYGAVIIGLGRLIPGFRIVMTVFAGIAKVNFSKFIFTTFFSSVIWIGIYMFLGQLIGPKTIYLFNHGKNFSFFITLPLIVIILFIFYLFRKNNKIKSHL